MKRKVFFPILAAAIIGSVLASSNFVSAQDTAGANSLVAAIAQKFNLNQSEVQAVFDEERAKREAEMKTAVEERLTQAVADGKITESQKQAIIDHFEEMKAAKPERGEFKNLTEDERKAKMGERRAEMNEWLSQNGLTHETLKEVLGGPFKVGRGDKMMFIHKF